MTLSCSAQLDLSVHRKAVRQQPLWFHLMFQIKALEFAINLQLLFSCNGFYWDGSDLDSLIIPRVVRDLQNKYYLPPYKKAWVSFQWLNCPESHLNRTVLMYLIDYVNYINCYLIYMPLRNILTVKIKLWRSAVLI